MDCEGTVIISCDTLAPEDIICKILGVQSLPESVTSSCGVKGYPWSFKNKYYSSTINLYALEEKAALNSTFCDSIKAVIFYFDGQKQSSFDDVLSWLPFLKDIDAEVKLLVCNNCLEESNISDSARKRNILQWCIDNQYELVVLNPISDNEDEDEESFESAKGYDRVIEALQSYTWANLVMEEEKTSSSLEETTEGSSVTSGYKTIKVEDQELDLEEKWLNDVLSGEDPGGESFEALFEKFASMKDRASGLNGDERKKYAEKVAIAFWRAMGGDEDEIEGLDSDE